VEPPAQLRKQVHWIEAHHDIGLDLVRAFLGIALFVRGMLLVSNPHLLDEYMPRFSQLNPSVVAHYVAIAHFAGGVSLMLGWLTRIAAFVQLPALFGALALHLHEGLLARTQSLELAALVLFLLVVIMIFGGGRLSLDYYVFHKTLPRGARTARANGSGGGVPRPSEPAEA
jgi:uncharacterized membrane protein YphA (DoxX/SURF4 family)